MARKEGIEDFYFVGEDSACRNKDKIFKLGFDAVYDNNVLNIHHNLNTITKIRLYIQREFLKMPTIFEYKDAIKYMVTNDAKEENVIPCIAPNWDHSPRLGRSAIVFNHSEPKYFEKCVRRACEAVKKKPQEKQLIMIKSWNEWGEGNHMEPDLKYGHGYLDALKRVINEEMNHESF